MKKLMLILLTAALLPDIVLAQSRRAICMEKCMAEPLSDERHREFEAKLKKVQAKMAATTDQQLIKQLAAEEEDEQDKYTAIQEKSCKKICGAFPQ